MGRYIGNLNQLALFYESGTYANSSGTAQWIGRVIDHTIDENMNVVSNRYTSTNSRNVGEFVKGPQDNTGTFTLEPQDWRMLIFALGSNVDAGSPSPYSHTISEADRGNAFTSGTKCPFMSFGLEDAQQACGTGDNFIRTVKGAVVNTLTLNGTQGEPNTMDVDYVAQDIDFSSGAISSLTEITTRPFVWSDNILTFDGTTVEGMMDYSWKITNNVDAKHVMNGSVVIDTPTMTNRDYELSVTVEAQSPQTKTFWESYFKGGSIFNAQLAVNASTGSRDMYLTMSGCKMIDMESPSKSEGTNEQTLTIIPKTCSVVVNDSTELYNPW